MTSAKYSSNKKKSKIERVERRVKKDYEVIIIGSGFGGQLAAMNLVKKGIDDFLWVAPGVKMFIPVQPSMYRRRYIH
jgi:hypothetical protein